MFKNYIPYAYANNVFEIDPTFYSLHNVKTLFIDLDNTLDSYKARVPSERVFALRDRLSDNNIEMVIISNNRKPRVEAYAEQLGVNYLCSARKPFKKRITQYMKDHNYNKDEVILVGDQLITDVKLGHNAGIRVILTEKIVKEDQWTTHFNRLLDRPIRKHLRKKGLLKKWVNVHGGI